MSERPIIWSFGGGTQSVAIGVLIAQGRLPMPERIVMADTGREASGTLEYTNDLMVPLFYGMGLSLEIIPHSMSRIDLYSRHGTIQLPMFTSGGGRLDAYCSREWKRDTIRRWARAEGYGRRKPVRVWLGISVDEVHRAKPSGVAWWENHYPLLFDVPLRRDECKALVSGFGYPHPPRSSCWMCPHRGDTQWRRLRDHYPQDWEAAITLEREIREKDDGLYLHSARVPLDQADLGDDQGELFETDGCDGGYCFV